MIAVIPFRVIVGEDRGSALFSTANERKARICGMCETHDAGWRVAPSIGAMKTSVAANREERKRKKRTAAKEGKGRRAGGAEGGGARRGRACIDVTGKEEKEKDGKCKKKREKEREREGQDGDAPGVMQQSWRSRVPWCVARLNINPWRRRAGGEVE